MALEKQGAEGREWSIASEEIERGIIRFFIKVPFDVEEMNQYWLEGNPPTLVDTGPYIPGLYNSLVSKFAEMRLARPGRVIVTHGHIDHYGLAREFSKSMGCKIWVHREDRDRVARHEEMLVATSCYYKGIAAEWGVLPVYQEMIGRVMEGFASLAHSAPVDKEMEGGEVFGDNELMGQIYHCPGHSAGQVIIHLPARGIIITGDHLLGNITPNPELYFPPRGMMISGLGDYIGSLAIAASLKAKLALPGHGKPFSSPAARAKEIVKHHKERSQRIWKLVEAGHAELLDLCWEVFSEELKANDPIQFFLATKEILGHLEILAREGRVNFIRRDGKRVAVV